MKVIAELTRHVSTMLVYLFHVLAFIYQVSVLVSDNSFSGTQSWLLERDTWRIWATWSSIMQAAHFGVSILEDVLRLLQGDNGAIQKFIAVKRNRYFTSYVFPQGTCASVVVYFLGELGSPWPCFISVTLLFLELFLKAHRYPSNRILGMISSSLFCFVSLYTIIWLGTDVPLWSQKFNHQTVMLLLICMSFTTGALYCLGEYITSVSWVVHRLLETLHNPQGLVGHNTFGIDGGPSQNRSRFPRGTALQKARVIFGSGSFSMEDANVHLTL